VSLDGRVAIVTGGARGIGRHYAAGLADAGARVAIGDVADTTGAAADIADRHGPDRVFSEALDVSDEASVRRFVAATREAFGRIDVLVNNAALCADLSPVPATDLDVELWDRVQAVNVRGVFLMCKHAAPHMRELGYGKIVNIASGMAFRGVPGMLHYATSKGAVLSLTRTLSRELGDWGIRVNAVAPGLTMSDTLLEQQPEFLAAVREGHRASKALKRDQEPGDLVGTVTFLASAESDFITGQTLIVDGGSLNS
jgi:NAD(P)-dependent dehydrogenase (short-subunit alcohol dehydrogenase family)